MGVKKIKRMVDVMRKFEKAITPKRNTSQFQICMSGKLDGNMHTGPLTSEQRKENKQKFRAAAKACKKDADVMTAKKARVDRLKAKLGV